MQSQLPSRREQIFLACQRLANEGASHRSQFTYEAIKQACVHLGYARGNNISIRKYREMWFEQHLPESDGEAGASGVAHERSLVQASIESLLSDHKQKIAAELKASYEARYKALCQDKENLECRLADSEEDMAVVKALFSQAKEEADKAREMQQALTAQALSLKEELGQVKQLLSFKEEELAQRHEKHRAELDALSRTHQQQLSQCEHEQALLTKQWSHQQAHYQHELDTLKTLMETQRIDALARQDKLETALKKAQGQYHDKRAEALLLQQELRVLRQEKDAQTNVFEAQLASLVAALIPLSTLPSVFDSRLNELQQQLESRAHHLSQQLSQTNEALLNAVAVSKTKSQAQKKTKAARVR